MQQITIRSIDSITPYGNNPRKNDEAVPLVANSIREFGFKVPIIIDSSGVIVAGHTRYKAAKELKLNEVPCIIADDLTEEQVKAFRLADNKTAEAAVWDFELLQSELDEILDFDMGDFGFLKLEEDEKTEPEINFTESLEEEHNYLVLYFDNDIDWLQAQSLFDIKPVKEYSTRKDGAINRPKRGVGRVIKGADALSLVVEGYFNED